MGWGGEADGGWGGGNILGNSFGFLCVSLTPDPPPFFLVKFSGFGRREIDKPSFSFSLALSVSPSWFRWNLIWIAAFAFGHSCTATGKEKEEEENTGLSIKGSLIWLKVGCVELFSWNLRDTRELDALKRAQLACEGFGHKPPTVIVSLMSGNWLITRVWMESLRPSSHDWRRRSAQVPPRSSPKTSIILLGKVGRCNKHKEMWPDRVAIQWWIESEYVA